MLTIRLDSPVPLAEQIRLGIRREIASGKLKPGDALPPVRQLAGDLGVNFNTVARAYRDLEQEGLVTSVRGRGTLVASSTETRREPGTVVRARLADRIRNVLSDARLAGLPRESVQRIMQQELAAFWTEERKDR